MAKKIGLLGGTFDPVHFGHINLAIELREKHVLDEIWFIPALQNPHKPVSGASAIEDRLVMLQLALKGIPGFFIRDVEMKRPPPSYTIETLRIFLEEAAHKGSDDRYYLLMGEDAVPSFFQWHLPEEIVKVVSLLIGSRSGIWHHDLVDYNIELRESIQKGMTLTRLMDISSSEIRNRIRKELYCGHLVPLPVLEYIESNQLYRH